MSDEPTRPRQLVAQLAQQQVEVDEAPYRPIVGVGERRLRDAYCE
ncbi:MAG TPA: hypothetical protein VMN35_05315 [Gaiellaceae bacterium]|nr:hypothetical protein [Gaiellaceae bacterium]